MNDEIERLIAAAERGDAEAACRLGERYRQGRDGVRHSPRQAYHWYARSALAGDPQGQNNLGACYEHGLGCRQSYAHALKWYRLAAAQACPVATSNLGFCYLHGHGVRADLIEAVRWFMLAVEQGNEDARKTLEGLQFNQGKE